MLNRQKHEIIMRNILKDIYSDSFLAPILIFKGGTALYFFHGLSRFSTDLDFNLREEEKAPQVLEKLKAICQKYGTLEEATLQRNTVFILLRYEKAVQKVKLEASNRDFQDGYELKNFLGITVPVMNKENMFAHKLVALAERKKIANRDLFDIQWFFQSNWDINEKIIQQRTGKSLLDYLKFLVGYIEKNITESSILDGLGELVDDKDKQKIKENLKKDTVFSIRNYLEAYAR